MKGVRSDKIEEDVPVGGKVADDYDDEPKLLR